MAITGLGGSWNFEPPVSDNPPTLDDIIAENQRLKEQLQQQRSHNHQLHNNNQQQVETLRQQVVGNNNNNLDEFSWEKILGKPVAPPQSSEPTVEPGQQKNGRIYFDSKEQLDGYVDQRFNHNRSQEQQLQQKLMTVQEQLQKKLATEHPELLDHADQINEFWNDSMALNPHISPGERYQRVIARTKAVVNRYTGNNGQQNPAMYGHLNAHNSMGYNANRNIQQNQASVDPDAYDAVEHQKELKARTAYIQSKMFD